MFTCKSCSRSVIRAFLSISAEEHGTVLRTRIPNVLHSNTKKSTFATNSRCLRGLRSPEEQARANAGLPIDIQTYEEAGAAVLKGNVAIRKVEKKSPDTAGSVYVSILDDKTPIDPTKLSRHANLEFKHIKESYHLAERCLAILKSGEFDMAVHLVRLAGQKGMDTAVSWNHIINTACQAGFLQTAYKLYHEMKKRGQKPDAYTFSILLRGYTTQKPLSLVEFEKAQTIYESLYLPNSPVKPNIIHSNIMLELCARAEALDVLFKVGSRLSERGPNSPDQITYTIIFNALSNAKIHDQADEDKIRLERVSQAKRIWDEVLEKWRSGSLLLGEELLCAMGRALLTSPSTEDQDSIFTFVEDFMSIPRQSPEFGVPLPKPDGYNDVTASKHSDSNVLSIAESLGAQDAPATAEAQSAITSELVSPPKSRTSIEVVKTNPPYLKSRPHRNERDTKSLQAAGLIFPKPGPRTLSLVLATCAKLGKFKVTTKYWDLLTKEFNPDTFNFVEYMRQIKISANSSLATIVLREVYKLSKNRRSTIQPHPALWEYGMAACYRAQDVQVALRDATRILTMLQMSTAEPSFDVIELFTKVLLKTEAGFPIEDIMRAEESLMMVFGNLKSLYAFGRTEFNGPPSISETLDEVVTDIDPKWQLMAKPPFRLSMSRASLLTEARSRLSMDERKGIRRLGRQIEIAFSKLFKIYGNTMTHDQAARIRSDLYRVRAWLFPRNQQLLNDVMEEDSVKKKSQEFQKAADPARSNIQKPRFVKGSYNRRLSKVPSASLA